MLRRVHRGARECGGVDGCDTGSNASDWVTRRFRLNGSWFDRLPLSGRVRPPATAFWTLTTTSLIESKFTATGRRPSRSIGNAQLSASSILALIWRSVVFSYSRRFRSVIKRSESVSTSVRSAIVVSMAIPQADVVSGLNCKGISDTGYQST